MAEPLKNLYNEEFVDSFSKVCKSHIATFDQKRFENSVFDKNWKNLELKERIRHLSICLHQELGNHIETNLQNLVLISEDIRINQNKQDTFEYIILGDYIEMYGLNCAKASLDAMEKITILASCEFAIRPFIVKYEDLVFKQLMNWTKHKHASVRRLASEGSRTRLPWGIGFPKLKKDPSIIYPILENLKDDESLYVRRSVANNINDLSKDHPKDILKLLKTWIGFSENRDWIVKHAARTLLKKGLPEALALFGYGNFENFDIQNFKVSTPKVKIGEYLHFNFSISNKSNQVQKLRLEYFIHFLLANGKLSKKVFKISERELASNETINYKRKQSFKIITTRKYYPGVHKISLVINGNELNAKEFELTV